jgi:hypothetical protein
MLELKQSTAVNVLIGPATDITAVTTPLTGLTIHPADIHLSKNGAALTDKSDASNCSHDSLGYYSCPLNTTDTNTLGRLQLVVVEATAFPIYAEYMVVAANYYDTKYSTDTFDVNVSTVAAAALDTIWDETLAGHSTADSAGLALKNLLKIGKNKWAYAGTTFTIYDDNGIATLYQFTLDSATTTTSRTPV